MGIYLVAVLTYFHVECKNCSAATLKLYWQLKSSLTTVEGSKASENRVCLARNLFTNIAFIKNFFVLVVETEIPAYFIDQLFFV